MLQLSGNVDVSQKTNSSQTAVKDPRILFNKFTFKENYVTTCLSQEMYV
jgi:hypothetical protein